MTESFRSTTISVAPNGGRLTKADHPALPLGPMELASTARACVEAGACLIHTHVRDGNGQHLLDASSYRDVIAAIRNEVGDNMIVQITSESLGLYTPAEQIAVVKQTRPEAVSLALRELVPTANEESGFAALLSWMKMEAVMPQIILYDAEEVSRLGALQRRGLLPWDDIPVLYVLGRYVAGQQSHPTDLLPFIASGRPRFAHWSVCAFGAREAACVTASALLGGHIRVGFENNRLMPDGQAAQSNADLVAVAARNLVGAGLRPMDASQLRHAWGNI